MAWLSLGLSALRSRFRRRSGFVTDHTPSELRSGRPFFVGTTLSALRPLPFAAQPDAVFELEDGSLVVIETECSVERPIDWADIVQLTVDAWVLRHSDDPRVQGRPVRTYGYIRFAHRGGGHYVRVDLLPDKIVATLWFMSWVFPTGSLATRPL